MLTALRKTIDSSAPTSEAFAVDATDIDFSKLSLDKVCENSTLCHKVYIIPTEWDLSGPTHREVKGRVLLMYLLTEK